MLLNIIALATVVALIVMNVRLRTRAVNAEQKLAKTKWQLKFGMTAEGHRLIAIELLKQLRAGQGDKQTITELRDHLIAARAELKDIGSDVNELSAIAYREIITKSTGLQPLAYR